MFVHAPPKPIKTVIIIITGAATPGTWRSKAVEPPTTISATITLDTTRGTFSTATIATAPTMIPTPREDSSPPRKLGRQAFHHLGVCRPKLHGAEQDVEKGVRLAKPEQHRHA